MLVVSARNVQEALVRGGLLLRQVGDPELSRDGPVLVAPCPVSTLYKRPWERVLLDPVRDANPFFHLMESVWMLAGRRDPQWLDRYVRNFSARFAEEGGEQHGAYGYRWRRHFQRSHEETLEGGIQHGWMTDLDQLLQVAEMLRRDPTTRRAVLAMWDPTVDLNLPSRDLPCNTHVYFRARLEPRDGPGRRVLDITVCCRSNDIVMGAYGANAVHMSIMGEVVAGLAGMRLGTYTQVSNNFHAYERDLGKIPETLGEDGYAEGWLKAQPICGADDDPGYLINEARIVLRDCQLLVEGQTDELQSAWFTDTVLPMYSAHELWREGRRDEALDRLANGMYALGDWRRAGMEWMTRRMEK